MAPARKMTPKRAQREREKAKQRSIAVDLFNGSATATLRIPSGGEFSIDAPVDGWDISAGSADVLRVALDGGGSLDVEYDIILTGVQ